MSKKTKKNSVVAVPVQDFAERQAALVEYMKKNQVWVVPATQLMAVNDAPGSWVEYVSVRIVDTRDYGQNPTKAN